MNSTAAASGRRRIAIETIPDIARPVRLHGTLGRAEVGGSGCFGVAIAVATR